MSRPKNAFDVIREVVFSYTGPLEQRSWPALDYADYRVVFRQEDTGGLALVGQGEAQGEGRAIRRPSLRLPTFEASSRKCARSRRFRTIRCSVWPRAEAALAKNPECYGKQRANLLDRSCNLVLFLFYAGFFNKT